MPVDTAGEAAANSFQTSRPVAQAGYTWKRRVVDSEVMEPSITIAKLVKVKGAVNVVRDHVIEAFGWPG